MTSVLVVEDDPSFATTLARTLESAAYRVTVAASLEQAVVALHAHAFDVLLTDLRLEEGNGIDLLSEVRSLNAAPRAILMSGYASARDHQTATDLGVVRVLCKPFTPSELLEAVRQAVECESGFHGTIHGMSLVDLLQMFHIARRSVSVCVGGSTPAILHLEGGEVVHATRGERVGVDAFVRTLNTRAGSVRTKAFDPAVSRSIETPFDALLLDALRAGDEYRRDSGPMPTAAELDLDDFDSFEAPAEAAGADLDRARALWQRAAAILGPTVAGATVVAFDAARAVVLQGSLDADAVVLAARSLLDASHRLVGSDDCNVYEYVSLGTVLAVFRAPRGDFALSLVDAVPHRSGVIWQRSAVATIGRIVCGTDK